MEFIVLSICILATVLLAVPLGKYINDVMNRKEVFMTKILSPLETGAYRCLGIDNEKQMKWKEYLVSVLALSGTGFLVLFLLLLFQGVLALNPNKVSNMSWDLALNTAVSFVTNTNWQAYCGEIQLSYLSQSFGLMVQNFISPAVGISILFALIRGISSKENKGIGNFWVDVTRVILYIFIPISLILSLALISQGVIQNFNSYVQVSLLENIFPGNGMKITSQIIPQGPVASQIAIKLLGGGGGGFFKGNSAYPFENPTALSNVLEMMAILLVPVSLCFAFGESMKNKKVGIALFSLIFFMLLVSIFTITVCEQSATPQLSQEGIADTSFDNLGGGNMEGKDARIGSFYSGTWTAISAVTANGSLNSSIDSYTPLGGLAAIIQIQMGGMIFGGIGIGLCRMLAFMMISAFLFASLFGKTSEYFGKKVEPFAVKMAVLICFTAPVMTLIGSGVSCVLPETIKSLTNIGPHGFSEVLYAFSSLASGNGSSFAGLKADSMVFNLLTSFVMIVSRIIPIVAILALIGSFENKAKSEGDNVKTLDFYSMRFFVMPIIALIIVEIFIFLPVLLLGPLSEFFQMLS